MANGSFAGGDGTIANPYLVEDAHDLNAIRNKLTAHYKLVSDIDMGISPYNEGEGWLGIGSTPNTTVASIFTGSIDGDKHTIKNLYANRPSHNYVCFVGRLSSGTIKNINLINVSFIGNRYVSGVSGLLEGTSLIENIYVEGSIESKTYDAGGIAGLLQISSKVANCSVNAIVVGATFVGGIASQASSNNVIIENCFVHGSVSSSTGSGTNIGGVVGYSTVSYAFNLKNCYSTALIQTSSTSKGGLIGATSNAIVTESYWDVETSGVSTSFGGTPKTTAEMKDPATFSTWDTTVWYLVDGEYPKLVSLIQFNEQVLVFDDGMYKYHNGVEWILIGSTVTEQDFIDFGISVSLIGKIPESTWQELTGTVELQMYTDDLSKTEVLFDIETEPFTLADEFANQTIKVIEYTDNPTQTESATTIETEPFSFYDEMGNEMDILYYTDDPAKTSAELEITANYSPLDEIEGDFEVVTWTNAMTEVQEDLTPVLSNDVVEGGSVYSTPIDLSKGIKKIE